MGVALHQGSALSLFLFAIMMNGLIDEVWQVSVKFADDIAICSENRQQMEKCLERWRYALERNL